MASRPSVHRWPVAVVGLLGGVPYGAEAQAALVEAEVLVGTRRHLDAVGNPEAERLPFDGPLADLLDTIAGRVDGGRRVCILASGDPGFFGIVRALADRFGPAGLAVHPAPSSVALAFARLGVPWDDAVVVSAHGRDLDEAAGVVGRAPQGRGARLAREPARGAGQGAAGARAAATATWRSAATWPLADEAVVTTDLAGLAAGTWDPLSVVVAVGRRPRRRSGHAGLGAARGPLRPPGRHDHQGRGARHRPRQAGAAPGRRAVGRRGRQRQRRRRVRPPRAATCGWSPSSATSATASGSAPTPPPTTPPSRWSSAPAPAALAALPDPDRVFVGGGGLDVLDAVLARLRPGGVGRRHLRRPRPRPPPRWSRLGSLVQVAVSRGERRAPAAACAWPPRTRCSSCWGPLVSGAVAVSITERGRCAGAPAAVRARPRRPGRHRARARWSDADGFVLCAPVGVAVRVVAPLLGSKARPIRPSCASTKPGRFAVAARGGHAGGANDLARDVAGAARRHAVVTTATDAARLVALWTPCPASWPRVTSPA